jgi:hypothetical protein
MRPLLASAGIVMSMQVAVAQTGGAPFCLKTATGQLRCVYATMGQCEDARPSASSDQCITRSDAAGTTGLGDAPIAPSGARGEQSPVGRENPPPGR